MGFSETAGHLVFGLALLGAAGAAVNAYFSVEHSVSEGHKAADARAVTSASTMLTGTFCFDGGNHLLNVTASNDGTTDVSFGNTTVMVDGRPETGIVWTIPATNGVLTGSDRWTAGEHAWGNLSYASEPEHVSLATEVGAASYLVHVVCPYLDTILVTPSSASLQVGGTQDFVATGYDQFGEIFGTVFDWSTTTGSIVALDDTHARLTAGTTSGTYTVTASNGTVSKDVTITLSPAAPASVTVTPAGAGVPAGGSRAYTATARDTYGNVNSTAPIVWSTSTGSISLGGTLTAPTAPTTGTVTATTTGPTIGTAGFTVYPAAPASATVTPDPITLPAGATQSFTPTLLDAYGNVNTTATVTWSTDAGSIDSSGVLTAATVPGSGLLVTATSGAAQGTANVTITAAAPASISITPDVAGLPAGSTRGFSATVYDAYGNVNSTATKTWGTSAGSIASDGVLTVQTTAANGKNVTVVAGTVFQAAVVDVIANVPATVTVSPDVVGVPAGSTQAFSAIVRDAFGNVNSTSGVTWSTNTGSISAAGVLTAPTTAAVGKTVTATSSGVQGTSSVTIYAAAPSAIALTPDHPGVTAGGSQAFTAVVTDTYGNVNSTATKTWGTSAGSISGAGVLTAQTTAATGKNVTIVAGSIFQATTVDIIAAAPSAIALTPSHPGVTAGGTQAFTAVVTDTYGNVNSTATKTWGTSAGSINAGGVLTAQTTAASNKNVTVVAGSAFQSTIVDVIAAAPSSIALTPSHPGVTAGTTQAFTAVVTDTYGNVNSTATKTWGTSAGSIDSSGVLTASTTAASNKNVTVVAGSVFQSTIVDVIAAAPATLTVSPDIVGVPAGGSQAFTATVRDTYGNVNSTASVTWSTNTGSIGSSSGILSAPTTPVSGKTVTGTTGAVSGTSSVAIYAAAPAAVAISPTSQTLDTTHTQQFTATATDAYGNTNSTATITWNATTGSVSSSGLYTAPSTVGTDYVGATTNGHTAIAVLTVQKHVHISSMATYLANASASSFRHAVDMVDARVVMVDQDGTTVSSVSVTLQWYDKNNNLQRTDVGTTGAGGIVDFYRLASSPNGAASVKVSAVSGTNLVWASASDNPSTETLAYTVT